jgi:hypothetical protein
VIRADSGTSLSDGAVEQIWRRPSLLLSRDDPGSGGEERQTILAMSFSRERAKATLPAKLSSSG